MTKKEIEQKFEAMMLHKIGAHDMWIIPSVKPPKYLYTFHITHLPTKGTAFHMIKINGGPVSLQGWFMPDQGIERIQQIIQETMDFHDKNRN